MFLKETALLNDRVRGKQNLKMNLVLMCKYYIVFIYLLLDLLLWRLFLLVHISAAAALFGTNARAPGFSWTRPSFAFFFVLHWSSRG